MSSCQGRSVRAILAPALVLALGLMLDEAAAEPETMETPVTVETLMWTCDGITLTAYPNMEKGQVDVAGLGEVKLTRFHFAGLRARWDWGGDGENDYSVVYVPANAAAIYYDFSDTEAGESKARDDVFQHCDGPRKGTEQWDAATAELMEKLPVRMLTSPYLQGLLGPATEQ